MLHLLFATLLDGTWVDRKPMVKDYQPYCTIKVVSSAWTQQEPERLHLQTHRNINLKKVSKLLCHSAS